MTEQAGAAVATPWPVVAGNYLVGDPSAPVAVCVLGSSELMAPLVTQAGVAIVGELQTANGGIEAIIHNVTTNPAIRFILICGKESRLFVAGQSLHALVEHGSDADGRIIMAQGYEPYLHNVQPEAITAFRAQVEVSDWIGETDLTTIAAQIPLLAARSPGLFRGGPAFDQLPTPAPAFVPVAPGGQRESLAYDPRGYFVISLDRGQGQIVLRHYLPDHTPAHEMRGRSAEAMVLGLLREGLISQMSHAGYLGGELAKAESALFLGSDIRYQQDRVLRRDAAPPPPATGSPPTRRMTNPQTWQQFSGAATGDIVDAILAVTDALPAVLDGDFSEPDPADPFKRFIRTAHPLRVTWDDDTKVVMGTSAEFARDAILRVVGTLQADGQITAQTIAILTHVASVS
jgi:tetrahydromethanopterin S-methyltransferase subunit A